MSPTEIIRIPILPLGIVNAHLIRSPEGCILVDAGIPGSERKIGRVLARHGLSFADIKLIVVTHAHTDHAGSAARLRALSGAPILAHEDDADFFSRKRPMTFCPTGLVGRLFLKTPAPHQPYEGFVPDLMMRNGNEVSLREFGGRRDRPPCRRPYPGLGDDRTGNARGAGRRPDRLGHSDWWYYVHWARHSPALRG